MTRFLIGKPRGGKTKRAVVWIIEILRTTNLPIVTNIALCMQPWVDGKGVPRRGLLRFLQDKYGSTFDAARRIHFISEKEDVRRFFSFRPMVPKNDWEPVQMLRLPPAVNGEFKFDANIFPACAYFIDEAHVFYPAHGLSSEKGVVDIPETLGYVSQAGRCGDLVFFITQVPTNVNKKLRTISQECHLMVNHAHASFGRFRQPNIISYTVYSSTPPGEAEQWMSRGMLRYDRDGIDSSYNTGAGVGVSGNTAADIGRRAKGLPMWVIPVVLVCLVLLGLYALRGVTNGVRAYMALDNHRPKMAGGTNETTGVFTPGQLVAIQSMFASAADEAFRRAATSNSFGGSVDSELSITSVAAVPGRAGVRLFLSDGSVVKLGDGRLTAWDASRKVGLVDGRRVTFR